MAACSLRFTSAGRPRGAAMACHDCTLASVTPLSSSVGTPGRSGERFSLVIASARSLPARICGIAVLTFMNDASTWLPSRSVITGPPPLYGTCTPVVPVCSQNNSAVRWSLLPLPEDAKLILPGLAFSKAITSARVLWGDAAGTTSTLGACTAMETGSRSFSASYGTLNRCGAITKGPSDDTSRV